MLIANLDYLWHDKRTLKFKKARRYLYVVLLLSFSVSIFVTIQDDKEKKQEIEQLTGKLDKVAYQFTGGDSYPNVIFAFYGPYKELRARLTNEGDYPLYDIQVRMLDLQKWNNLLNSLEPNAAIPEEETKKAETLFPPVTLGPHSGTEICRVNIPIGLDTYGFNIWIYTRYKKFVQEVRFRRFEAGWRIANRLSDGDKWIYEKIPKEFLSTDSVREIW